MSTNRDFDRIAGAWMAEGPNELADRVLDDALAEVHLINQRRGLFAPWRYTRMTAFSRAIAAVLVAALVLGGAVYLLGRNTPSVGGPSPSPVPSTAASEPPLPKLDATFVSPSYGYQIGYPTGWTVSNGIGPWPPGTERFPGDPVSDAIVTPSGTYRVRFSGASIALPAGMTMDQFRAFASPLSSPFNSDPCSSVAPVPLPVTINAQMNPATSPQPVEAVVSINGCDALAELGGYIYDVEVIAGGRGYTFTLDGHITTADVLAWLASIQLEPANAAPTASAVPSPSASK
jgi:hypothetical protein